MGSQCARPETGGLRSGTLSGYGMEYQLRISIYACGASEELALPRIRKRSRRKAIARHVRVLSPVRHP